MSNDGLARVMLTVNGRRTSVRLEPVFANALPEIAAAIGLSVHDLASRIERDNEAADNPLNLSSAIRAYVAGYYRDLARPQPCRLVASEQPTPRPSIAAEDAIAA